MSAELRVDVQQWESELRARDVKLAVLAERLNAVRKTVNDLIKRGEELSKRLATEVALAKKDKPK